ncbi:MAG: hypothetical protein OWU33_06170 [Firmicutes bacterium]|nr:hypothetical protein [Bacillota bacterium]
MREAIHPAERASLLNLLTSGTSTLLTCLTSEASFHQAAGKLEPYGIAVPE